MIEGSAEPTENMVSAVPVEILNKEWANGEDSGDEDVGEKHSLESCSARDRRVSEAAEVLSSDPIIGDVDVEVITETKDWVGAGDLDVEGSSETHMSEVFEAREERLRRASDELAKQQMIGDNDVEIIAENKDWSGAEDTDLNDGDESLEKHLTGIYEAREERLSRGSEELEKKTMIGDTDVEVITESKEWAGEVDGEIEETIDSYASNVFEERERRLTVAAEEMEKKMAMGDTDIEVMNEVREWSGEAMVPEDADDIEKYANEVFLERERRLTVAAEELDKGLTIGDTDVEVITEAKEWAELGEDDNDDQKDTSEQHANEMFETRERRLTAAAEELNKEMTIGDTDVEVVNEDKEWDEVGDDEDDSCETEQHASAMFEVRERRLTAAAQELDKCLTIGDAEVEVIAEGKEWNEFADDDEEEKGNSEQHANEIFESRERRLTVAAEELSKELGLGDAEVELVNEDKEWDEEEDDENEGCNTEQLFNDLFESRERRLTVAEEELKKELGLGDAEVELVNEDEEWDEEEDDENEGCNTEQLFNEIFESRERRLTVAAEELNKELGLGDAEVELVNEDKEWDEAEDDENEGCNTEQHASEMFESRERRLTVGAQELDKGLSLGDKEVELVDEEKEWDAEGDDESDGCNTEQHASEMFEVRERRLTAGATELDKALTIGDAEVEVVPEGKEWDELDDDDDADTNEHAAEMFEVRERRLTATAEALQSIIGAEEGDLAPVVSPALGHAEAETKEVTQSAPAEEEEESEWETEEEIDEEIFKRANPDRGLRRGNEESDPWRNVFKWIAGVVKHRRAMDEVPKALEALVGSDPLDHAALTPESLCDGKILCALVMALQPEALRKPIPNAMGRLGQVVKACKQFGVKDADLFGVPDIISSPPQNPNAVLRCVTALSAIVATWEEYSGPKLRRNR